jgi:hypothetical protein
MGIIVKHWETGKIIFYLKGAEEALKDKVVDSSLTDVVDDSTDLAQLGLRTLVVS